MGLNYETEKKRYQRWVQAGKTPKLLHDPKLPSFPQGTIVKDKTLPAGASPEFTVVGDPNKAGEPELVPEGGDLTDAVRVPATWLVRVRFKKVATNDLILCDDNKKVYRYTGKGVLQLVDNSALLKQVRKRDDAEFEAEQTKNQQREQAAAKDKTEMKEYQRYGQPHNSEDQAAKDKADMEKHRPPNKPKPAGKVRPEQKEVVEVGQ
jgi:hypothetical protein